MKLSEIKEGRLNPDTGGPAATNAERVIHLTYEAQGKSHKATFTARVLDMSARISRDRALAMLSAPARFDDLPTAARLRIFALATLAHALIDAPAWVEEWIGLDDELLFSLYEEVAAHEAAFFRGDMEKSTDQEERPRVQLRALDTAPRS